MSARKNVEWLWHRTELYRSTTNDMCEAIGELLEPTTRELRRNHFMSETLFGRLFCLLGLKVTSSESCHRIGKDRIELRK
jgi:hypothetical protein